MKKAVLIIPKNLFRDEEYFETKQVLESAGISVTTASSQKGECTGKFGGRANADISLNEINASDFDAAAFIGGPGASQYFNDKTAHSAAKSFVQPGKLLCAICAAPNILAQAGILKGRKATAFPDFENDLKKCGAIWTGRSVEIDGNIITANGPEAAKEFGIAIAELLGRFDTGYRPTQRQGYPLIE